MAVDGSATIIRSVACIIAQRWAPRVGVETIKEASVSRVTWNAVAVVGASRSGDFSIALRDLRASGRAGKLLTARLEGSEEDR